MVRETSKGVYLTTYLPRDAREYLGSVGDRTGLGTNALVSQLLTLTVRFMQRHAPGLNKKRAGENDDLASRVEIADMMAEIGRRLT